MTDSVVQFMNVDLDLYGAFDRDALRRGFGNAAFVLYERGEAAGGPDLSFEVNGPETPTLSGTLVALIALVRALPTDGRAAWDAATRRVFDIGIQSGRTPHSTHWSIDANVLTDLGEIKADLAITVYGGYLEG